jgi:hypothetical protein
MIITYGCLSFEVENVYRWDNRAIYDETSSDYLYNHVVIGVQAVFNPFATVGNDYTGEDRTVTTVGKRTAIAGKWGADTVRDISALLLQPRQKLTIHLGGIRVLESPLISPDGQPYPCDAKNGPKPLSFRVIAIHGEGKTLICSFEIETFINAFNSPQPGVTPTVLSHRWTMNHDIDPNFITTRTITGQALFRKDYLTQHPQYGNSPVFADDFRAKIFHPIPKGFKRSSVRVTLSPDGTQLFYTLVDKEQMMNIYPGYGVHAVSGTYTFALDYTMFDLFKAFHDLKAGDVAGVIKSTVPNRTRRFTVTVQGFRDTSFLQLFQYCGRAAAAWRMYNPMGANGILASADNFMQKLWVTYQWHVDIMEPKVTLTLNECLTGVGQLFKAFNGYVEPNDKPAWAGLRGWDDLVTAEPIDNPTPTYKTRGTSLIRMISQSLMGPAEVPAAPPDANAAPLNLPLSGAKGY